MSSILQLNAMANRAAGKGYENEGNYANIRFRFIGIENIHVMRSSLQKLLEGTGISPGLDQRLYSLHNYVSKKYAWFCGET